MKAVCLLLLITFRLAPLLAGCAGGQTTPAAATPVSLRATVDANGGEPVAVDLVAVYDPALVDRVTAMSAAQWFEQRPRLLVEHAGGGLAAWSFEVAPGELLAGPQAVIYDQGARALLLFAHYFSPGRHVASLPPGEPVRAQLDATGFRLPAR